MQHVRQSFRISEAAMLRVALLVPDGFATFSFAPLAAFEAANLVLGECFYDVHVTSVAGGRVANSFGMEVDTECVEDSAFDTLLVGSPPDVCPPSQQLLSFLRGAPTNTRRVASICIAAFILGEAGLLDGRRATTHWMFAAELRRRYPKATVEVDRIFIADGPIWTSAGMTAGLDLALSLVVRDLRSGKARRASRVMVLYLRRAGVHS